MHLRHVAVLSVLAMSLSAEEGTPGFGWVGIRAGTLSFDPQEHLKAATHLGGQGGLVLREQRYGFSLEVLASHPVSQFDPTVKLAHNEVSATFLSGLAGDALGRFWPYLGLGLGSMTVASNTPTTLVAETKTATALHASLGLMHRPGAGLIWGAEGRYIITFTSKDRKDLQATAMLGFTWGGPQAMRAVAPSPAPTPAPAPEPPPRPAVEPAATSPAPVPVAPAPATVPVEEAAPPKPVAVEPPPPPAAPVPEPEPVLPPPPPPAPVLAPVPAKADVEEKVVAAPMVSSLDERLDALRREDMVKALAMGRTRIAAIPPRHWTIRLEIANLPSTLANAVKAFPSGKPDLFIAPIKLKGGKTAYQLFLGDYPSLAEAERAAKSVPAFFLEGGQRPRPFLGTEIPAH